MPAHAQNTITQTLAQVAAAGIDGVNIDYEGTLHYCSTGPTTPGITNRDLLTAFVKNFRAAMPNGYLAIDTFSGSAEDNQEFFDITGLAPNVDSFFVMAYDMDYANYPEIPLSCASYCFNPISPLNTYRFNVTKTVAQYTGSGARQQGHPRPAALRTGRVRTVSQRRPQSRVRERNDHHVHLRVEAHLSAWCEQRDRA